MSVTVMAQVYATKLGSAPLKAVALKLADYANDAGGNIFPALDTIALHTEVSKSTAQRSVRALLDAGILEVESQGGKGPGSTTRYRFNLTRLASAPKLKKDGQGDHGGQSDHVAKVVRVTKKVVRVTTEPSVTIKKENTPPAPSQTRGTPRKLSALPEDWHLPDSWFAWAKTYAPSRELCIRREADKFRDHWKATGNRKADWEATWRNWWRRACETPIAKSREWKTGGGGRPRDTSEPWADYKARMIREGKITA